MAIVFALLAGIFTAAESAINSQLGKQITPSIATLHSLATGAAFMLAVSFLRGSYTRYPKIFSLSPVWLIGGILGALIIYLSSKAIPVLGVSRALTLILAAQILTGLVIDAVYHGSGINVYQVFGVLFFLLGANLIIR
ncbi:DMT family transporter [Oscillibacter sp.]|uniref:DMT family transporter n=1 Tax=Oscillibacter sp. TaxID=1945593 RepID=UPI002603F31D|nr:DMT family transporter [Oscillibacter sp.]MDD3346871.1 DMT family transporter [Oscillibacter sp.]